MIRCVDIFSGCGGLSLGFQNSGFKVVSAYDNWRPAIDVYEKNFSHPVFNLDLRGEKKAIKNISKYHPSIIIGGPPCQDFSSAGKRNIKLGRANLTYTFANIVCAIRPQLFVMENVEQIKKSYILDHIVSQFIKSGYGLSSAILDASFCNVPQKRTRLFLIGDVKGQNNQLDSILRSRLSDRPMSIRDCLGNTLGINFYYRHPRNYNRRGVFSIDEPSPTIRGVNRPIPSGYKINKCDPQGIILKKIRPLTTIERSYIQTFPKTFKFFGTKTNLEQMIGNSVPVNLAEYVADSIKIHLSNKKANIRKSPNNIFNIPQRVLSRSKKL